MKFFRLSFFSVFFLFFLLCNSVYSVEKKSIFLLSNSPIKGLPKGISQVHPVAFLQNHSAFAQKPNALIFNYGAVKNTYSESKEYLKDLLLGDQNLPMFAMGYGMRPNSLDEFFGLKNIPRIEFDFESKSIHYATGIYNFGPSREGPFMRINFFSDGKLTYQQQLESIHLKVNEIKKLATRGKPKAPPFWYDMHIESVVSHKEECGKYNQRLIFKKKINDGLPNKDLWSIEVFNESVSGMKAYKTEYVNKKNQTKVILDYHNQEIVKYQPEGEISKGSNVSLNLGYPPSIAVSWNTGETSIRNESDMHKRYCKWFVNYNTKGNEAEDTHAWTVGILLTSKESEPISIKIENDLEWLYVSRPARHTTSFKIPDINPTP
jgi:hypothetical protein